MFTSLFAFCLFSFAADPIPGESLFSEPQFKKGDSWQTDLTRTTQMFLTTEYIVAGDNRMQSVDQLEVQEEVFKQTVDSTNSEGEIQDFTRTYEKQTVSTRGEPAVAGPLQGLTLEIKPEDTEGKLKVYRHDDAEKTTVDLPNPVKLKALDEDQSLPNKVHRILEDIFAGKQVKAGDTFDVPDKSVVNLLDFDNNAAVLKPNETDVKVTIEKITDDRAHLSFSGKIMLVIGSSANPNGALNFDLKIEDWKSVYRRAPFFELERTVKGAVNVNSIREIGDTIISTSGNGMLSEVRKVEP